jgi:pyruvate kinase
MERLKSRSKRCSADTSSSTSPTEAARAPSACHVSQRAMSPPELIAELSQLERELIESAGSSPALAEVHPAQKDSAENLLHYLTLRLRDLRPLQAELSRNGLSSLGRAEPHVLPTLQAVRRALTALAREEDGDVPATAKSPPTDWGAGPALLNRNTEALLGPPPSQRSARIMVTMPSEAADDPVLVRDLLRHGMDCMRINCAHDDAAAWLRMIDNLRRAERDLGRTCRVSMDRWPEAPHRAASAPARRGQGAAPPGRLGPRHSAGPCATSSGRSGSF